MCDSTRVPISRFLDRLTTITKATIIALIKVVDNPLYKVKTSRAVVSVTMMPGPPSATLLLEEVSITLPKGEASEQPEGDSRPPPSVAAGTQMLVKVPYDLLSRFVIDQRQTTALLEEVIERLT